MDKNDANIQHTSSIFFFIKITKTLQQ